MCNIRVENHARFNYSKFNFFLNFFWSTSPHLTYLILSVFYSETVAKSRLQLIKIKALEFIAYLKHQSSTLYQKMDEWIGEYYQQEVNRYVQYQESMIKMLKL